MSARSNRRPGTSTPPQRGGDPAPEIEAEGALLDACIAVANARTDADRTEANAAADAAASRVGDGALLGLGVGVAVDPDAEHAACVLLAVVCAEIARREGVRHDAAFARIEARAAEIMGRRQ